MAASAGVKAGAAVVLKPGASLTLDELRLFGGASLSPKWLPEVLRELDAIPRGPTGKPARIGLAQRLGVEELGAAPAAGGCRSTAGGGGPLAYDSLAIAATGATRLRPSAA